ncbi:hypothetical protein BKA81DRAFT_357270 [Phyllosticta paracitricarpa]
MESSSWMSDCRVDLKLSVCLLLCSAKRGFQACLLLSAVVATLSRSMRVGWTELLQSEREWLW